MGIKLFLVSLVMMAAMSAGFGWYYKQSQATIATLRENNAKLEVAVDTAQASIETLQSSMAKANELNLQLQQDLQAAEAYGDELRSKLSKLNLVVEALKDSKTLEGKMNGATAKLWREFMSNTGNTNNPDLPSWLRRENGTGSESSDTNTEGSDTNSSETETTPAE